MCCTNILYLLPTSHCQLIPYFYPMFTQLLNWRTGLALVAIGIVTGTIFYSNYLSKKIASDERKKVSVWVQALKTSADPAAAQSVLDLTNIITSENTDIPIIETNENDVPSGQGLNLDGYCTLLRHQETF